MILSKFSKIFLIAPLYSAILVIACHTTRAQTKQNIIVTLGNSKISLNEPFTISIESQDQDIEEHNNFPEINGMKKIKGIENVTSAIPGKGTKIYIRTQMYHPIREGTFNLPPFSMLVNNQEIKSPGTTIIVGQYDKNKKELVEINYQDLAKKFIEVKEDAFLGITVDKESVFVGEGFNITLAFYVSTSNLAPMAFIDMKRQVEEIAQQLKPSNCWEENFGITTKEDPIHITIGDKEYDQHLIYQATFFPINTNMVNFPAIDLKVKVKNKLAQNTTDKFDEDAEANFKTFSTQPKKVVVKDLPQHPLKDKIPVGSFYLVESMPKQTQHTGESFPYTFKIVGEGNIAAINAPKIYESKEFVFYPPNIYQYIARGQNKVTGTMVFNYQTIPKEAGKYSFNKYFEWIYFNLNTQRYDTLRARKSIQITGESLRNAEISASRANPFYKQIAKEDNHLHDNHYKNRLKIIFEIIVFILIIIPMVLMYKK